MSPYLAVLKTIHAVQKKTFGGEIIIIGDVFKIEVKSSLFQYYFKIVSPTFQ
jgi:hypothetical protein